MSWAGGGNFAVPVIREIVAKNHIVIGGILGSCSCLAKNIYLGSANVRPRPPATTTEAPRVSLARCAPGPGGWLSAWMVTMHAR